MAAAPILGTEIPLNARRDSSGLYTWAGVQYPSVTTIIQMFGGDNLTPWAAKMSSVECADIVQRRMDGFLSSDEADELILDWSRRMTAHIRFRDHAGRRGSLVHHCLYEKALGVSVNPKEFHEYLLHHIDKLGLIGEPEDTAESYADKLAKETSHYVIAAFEWIEKENPEFEAIGQEATVISETHGYAGTGDAIAKIRGQRLQLDFKTSASKQERKWQLQIEAYRRADFIGLLGSGERFEVPETDGGAVVWIKPIEPVELIPMAPRDDYFEAFLSMRQAFGVLHDLPKPNARQRAAPKPPKPPKGMPNF